MRRLGVQEDAACSIGVPVRAAGGTKTNLTRVISYIGIYLSLVINCLSNNTSRRHMQWLPPRPQVGRPPHAGIRFPRGGQIPCDQSPPAALWGYGMAVGRVPDAG